MILQLVYLVVDYLHRCRLHCHPRPTYAHDVADVVADAAAASLTFVDERVVGVGVFG